jgi:protoporphyrin/coproporphyrin ferrochelatase
VTDEYQAILVVSFGGPEKMEDVIPFLENVLRGRNVPRERLLEVAEHYAHFDGYSPINDQCRDLIAALDEELQRHDIELPIFWGNRNWHPMLAETMQQMADAGIERVLAYVTAGYGGYSGCRQYLDDIEQARQTVGDSAPVVDKIRLFYNHPLFAAANAENLRTALAEIPAAERDVCPIAFTAHSIPQTMADTSNYVQQLEENCRLVAEDCGVDAARWQLVYQSRSGRPQDPWLEPDICDHLRTLHADGAKQVVVMPLGFLSDHMEVIYDLDDEAAGVCAEIGLNMVRAKTVGTHPLFIQMIRELIEERIDPNSERRAVGQFGPAVDLCPADCCPRPQRRPTS